MISAIILAAGQSTRMGGQKLLMPLGGSIMAARVVDAYLNAPVDSVHVVLSNTNRMITDALGKRPVRYAINENVDSDMLGSVRCGLRSLPPQTTAVFISPGDQPSLESSTIQQMIEVFSKSQKKIIVPIYSGTRGHPLLFASCFINDILTSFDNVGLRGLLASHPDDLFEWTAPNSIVLEDVDTPEDFQRAAASFI
jgi:molybdenum cofactor cytidylyltransferase